jgi:hypothetical protein
MDRAAARAVHYKDEELHPSSRFDAALKLLESIGLRDPLNKDSETLGLGGAVYKGMWERRGKLDEAYAALNFYRAAWRRNPEQDRGFGGVNAAFLLDVSLCDRPGSPSAAGGPRRRRSSCAPRLGLCARRCRRACRRPPSTISACGAITGIW